jgi:Flp pilus assembly pilin Flp
MFSQNRALRHLRKPTKQFCPNRRGATTVEYAVMLLTVLAVIFGMVVLLGSRAGWLWSANSAQLDPVLQGGSPLSQLPSQPADDGDSGGSNGDSDVSPSRPLDPPTDSPRESGSEARAGSSASSPVHSGGGNRSGRQQGRGRSR